MADLNDDILGRMLGEFLVRERIDEGGFGVVYRCDQPLLGRGAIVKVLHQRLRGDNTALQRFMREGQLASRLDHPYAAHVYMSGVEEDGLLWIAMELVHGVTLDRWLKARGPLSLDQFVPFFDRVAEVVQAAHERGLVHRDLKPSNIMVTERAGRLMPKLLDFGVAKLLDEVVAPLSLQPDELADDEMSSDDDPPSDPDRTATRRKQSSPPSRSGPHRLTGSDAVLGSPSYMSPEQWTDATAVGPAADLYALGVVAYEALSGRRPFTAVTPAEYGELHQNMPVPTLGGKFPPTLDHVFERALAKRPEDRWGSALEFAEALGAALRTHMREQLRLSAQQWEDQDRPDGLLWRGEAFAKLERWARRAPPGVLNELECSFVAANQRYARRGARIRRLVIALAAVSALGVLQYRAVDRTRMADQIATESEVEQGRQALLQGESSEAVRHLEQAFQRGEHSSGLTFMLARALQPRMSELARFTSSSGRMWSAMFAPDGKRVLTTDDKSARMWDAESSQLLFTMSHGDTVYRAVFSPDGSRIITAGGDGTVRIWNAATGAPLRELTYQRSGAKRWRYSAVAMSSHFVAAIDMMGRTAHVWDAETGTRITELTELANDASEKASLAFSPDGRWLATTGGDDVRVFDTSTWQPAVTIAGPRVRSLNFDPTGPRLAVGTYDGVASIWEISSGMRARSLRDGGASVDAVAFSRDGGLVAAASRDGTEQVWDAASGGLRTEFNSHHDKIYAIEFSSTGDLMLSAGADGAVVVSNVARGCPLPGSKVPTASSSPPTSIRNRVASSARPGTVPPGYGTLPRRIAAGLRRWSARSATPTRALFPINGSSRSAAGTMALTSGTPHAASCSLSCQA